MPKSFDVAKEHVIEKLNKEPVDDLEEHALLTAKVAIAESMTEASMKAILNRKRKESDDLKKDIAEQIKKEMEAIGGRRTRKRRANRKKTRRA